MKTIEQTKSMIATLLKQDEDGLKDILQEVESLKRQAARDMNTDAGKQGMILATKKILQAQSAVISIKTRIDTFRFLLEEIER